jgi:hypothetical protein
MHFYPPRTLCAALQFFLLGAIVVTSSTNAPGLKGRQLNDPVSGTAPAAAIAQPRAAGQPRPVVPTGSTVPEEQGRPACPRMCERHQHAGAGRTTAG